MLGRYKNFPENVHGVALFEHLDSAKEVQKAILCTFYRLNQETVDLSAVTPYLKQDCTVGFEFGVADGVDFNFLDQKELEQCLKSVDETEMETIDFFLAVRYHRIGDGGKQIPLKFDYHVLRFAFQEGGLELLIRHEKGTMRIALDELTAFISKRINAELSQKQVTPLFLRAFEKVGLR
ncbi:MAG TPA: hypothetical protein ENN36_06740 [Candidatus Bathyarchaeota archaeon]|nr:hypothetical protein [Candidatus Bathyarchaeota archaeon]